MPDGHAQTSQTRSTLQRSRGSP